MNRPRFLAAIALALLVLITAGPGPPTRPPLAEAAFPAAEISQNLVFDCLPNATVRLNLRWSTFNAGLQFVDLSLFNNDFAGGTFLGLGPFAPGQSSFAWDGLVPGAFHYVRINTFTAAGWAPSQTLSFFTPADCQFAAAAPPFFPPPTPQTCVGSGPFAACLWTAKPDYAPYVIGEPVVYCYSIAQPMNVRVVVTRPDGSAVLVTNGFDGGAGACVGPYQANVPFGLRTASLYGGPADQLLAVTHFYVQ